MTNEAIRDMKLLRRQAQAEQKREVLIVKFSNSNSLVEKEAINVSLVKLDKILGLNQ